MLAGTLTRLGTAEARDALVALGARVADHVTPGIDLVFAADDGGADAERAIALDIPVHGEPELVALLAAAGAARMAEVALERVLGSVLGGDDAGPVAEKPPRSPIAAEVEAMQEIRWGLPLARLLLTYLRVLARRPDVHVLVDAPGAPASAAALQRLEGRVPPALLALAAELASLHFEWALDPDGKEGGRLRIGDLEVFAWQAPPPDEAAPRYAGRAVLDAPGREAAELAYTPDQAPTAAEVVWAGEQPLGTVEAYLTAGARVGFARGWQKPTQAAGRLARKLLAASLPRDTPEGAVVDGLVAHGLVPAEAAALVRWLGADAVILLPR